MMSLNSRIWLNFKRPGTEFAICGCNVTCSDTLIVVILDAVTSIFAGFAIFSIIGHLAHTLNTGVDQVVASGMFTVELCVRGKKK